MIGKENHLGRLRLISSWKVIKY